MLGMRFSTALSATIRRPTPSWTLHPADCSGRTKALDVAPVVTWTTRNGLRSVREARARDALPGSWRRFIEPLGSVQLDKEHGLARNNHGGSFASSSEAQAWNAPAIHSSAVPAPRGAVHVIGFLVFGWCCFSGGIENKGRSWR